MADNSAGNAERINSVVQRLPSLGAGQLEFIDAILTQLLRPAIFTHDPSSDLVNDCVLREFGDVLRIHHCFSAEPFTKDRFEYALEASCNKCGIKASRSARGNPGHDLNIREIPFSLKTQANKGIKAGLIHISKFMELGRGQWSDDPADLIGLRDQFFRHMQSYERILTLRRLPDVNFEVYELVEIPKSLLLEAKNGHLEMMNTSTQFPRPGYCTVRNQSGGIKFQLYFDGGTERKLQIRSLDKSFCKIHATWKFPVNEPVAL